MTSCGFPISKRSSYSTTNSGRLVGRTNVFLLTFLLQVLSLHLPTSLACPNDDCICIQTDVFCSEMTFDRVPDFYPDNITYNTLDIGKNKISRIRAEAFRGVNTKKIKMLRNEVRLQIHRKAFRGVEGLVETIFISRSHLISLPAGLFKKMKKLRYVDFSGNRLTKLPNGVFRGARNLQRLDLMHNQIRYLQANVFSGLRRLKVLRLGSNHISLIESNAFAGLRTLEEIELADNIIRDLQPRTFQKLPDLRELDMSDNKIPALFPLMLTGTAKLQELKLAENPIIWIADDTFAEMAVLRLLNLEECWLTYLKPRMFHGLTSLEDLRLGKNNLTSLKDGSFQFLPKLQRVRLQGNALRSLNPCAFEDVKKVKEIWVYENQIQCECDMRWTAQVAPQTVIKGKCAGPSRQHDIEVNDRSNYEGCKRKAFKCPRTKRDHTDENRTERKKKRRRVF